MKYLTVDLAPRHHACSVPLYDALVDTFGDDVEIELVASLNGKEDLPGIAYAYVGATSEEDSALTSILERVLDLS